MFEDTRVDMTNISSPSQPLVSGLLRDQLVDRPPSDSAPPPELDPINNVCGKDAPRPRPPPPSPESHQRAISRRAHKARPGRRGLLLGRRWASLFERPKRR